MSNLADPPTRVLTAPTISFYIDREDVDLESDEIKEWEEQIKQQAEEILNSLFLEQDFFSESEEKFQIELDVDFEEGSIKAYLKHTAVSLTFIIGICVTGNNEITPEKLAQIHSPAVEEIQTVISEITGTEAESGVDEWSDPDEWKKHFESFDEALYVAPAAATFAVEPGLLMSLKLADRTSTTNREISWYLAEKKNSLEIIIQVQNLDDLNPAKYEGKIILDLIEGQIEKSGDLERASEAGKGLLEELLGCALLQLAEWLSHKFSNRLSKKEVQEVKNLTEDIENSKGKILQKFFLCVNTLGLFVMGFK